MKKFALIVGYVLTLGLLHFFRRSKKGFLNYAKVDANLDNLISLLGGKNNIVNLKASATTLKVDLKDVKMVNKEALNKICKQGTILTSSSLTMLLGSQSKTIASKIQAQLD